ncbi:MAG: hypothetical protein ABIO83_10280 [Ilumatobacteraceae bacterium]
MSQPGHPPPSSSGERWNINMPAVIGAVFVFLVGVIVWVVLSSGGDGDITQSDGTAPPTLGLAPTTSAPSPATVPGTQPATPGTTSPAPMPDPSTVPSVPPTTVAPATTAPATAPPTAPATDPPTTTSPPAPPATTAPGAGPGTVPGDLGITGRPMLRPACDDSSITIIASAVGPQATAASIADVLRTYPGSNYLRTDETCPSLNPSVDGQPIYVVYFGPFAFDSDACTARADGTEGSYAKRLSEDVRPSPVTCL